MTKQEKNDVIVLLKEKFNQYSNFYVTDTESLTVAQIGKLRNTCFNKQVEVKVAKNTLIRKALEGLDAEKYVGVYDSLHKVTALMFSENPKEPALILTSFRKESKKDKPVLKAAFINGDIYIGDDQLVALTNIKTKNELIGEVLGLLQSPAKRVLAALLNHHENGANATTTEEAEPVAAVVEDVAVPVVEAAKVTEIAPVTEVVPAVEAVPVIEAVPVVEAATTEEAVAPKAPVAE